MKPITDTTGKAPVTEDRLWLRQAVKNTLLIGGRYLLANGEEYPCQFRCVTLTRGEIVAQKIGDPGEVIICYIDRIGIILGVIEDFKADGVSVIFKISKIRHDRVLARLEWHAARALEHIELRNGARIVPLHKDVTVKTVEEYLLPGEIIDISLSGASISLSSKRRPSVGQMVIVGRRKARVVRLVHDGIAVQFEVAFKAEDFGPNIVL